MAEAPARAPVAATRWRVENNFARTTSVQPLTRPPVEAEVLGSRAERTLVSGRFQSDAREVLSIPRSPDRNGAPGAPAIGRRSSGAAGASRTLRSPAAGEPLQNARTAVSAPSTSDRIYCAVPPLRLTPECCAAATSKAAKLPAGADHGSASAGRRARRASHGVEPIPTPTPQETSL